MKMIFICCVRAFERPNGERLYESTGCTQK
jgi:hypothetical protein